MTRMPLPRLIATLKQMENSWWLAIVLPSASYCLAISRAIEELEKVAAANSIHDTEPQVDE